MGCHLRNPQVYCFPVFPVSSDTTDVPLAFSRVASHTDLQISSSFLWMYHIFASLPLNPQSIGLQPPPERSSFQHWHLLPRAHPSLPILGHLTAPQHSPGGRFKQPHHQPKGHTYAKNVALNHEQDTCLWSESCNTKAECPVVGPQLSTSSDKILCSFYMFPLLTISIIVSRVTDKR